VAARRKVQDEGEARRFLAAVKRSGGSRGEWARARGIDGRSLRAWEMNLARRGTSPVAPSSRQADAPQGLVELVPIAAAGADRGNARYVLEMGGARLEFGDDAAVTTLRRVVEVLRR
jgi:hypothetical protein